LTKNVLFNGVYHLFRSCLISHNGCDGAVRHVWQGIRQAANVQNDASV
jgi:hypothetical protein